MKIEELFERTNTYFLMKETKAIITPVIDKYQGMYEEPSYYDLVNFKTELEQALESYFISLVKENPPKSINLDYNSEYAITVYFTIFEVVTDDDQDAAQFVYTDKYVSIEMYMSRGNAERILDGRIKKDDSINYIATMFSHEATHYMQIRNRNLGDEFKHEYGKFSQDKSKIRHGNEYQRYLSTPVEIGAYASQAANELVYYLGNKYKVLNAIRSEEGIMDLYNKRASSALNNIVSQIKLTPGKGRSKVWREFKKQLYQNLEAIGD